MTDPTDQPTADPGPTVGRQVDDLLSEIDSLGRAIRKHSRDLHDAERKHRARVDNLVGLIGRPAAAALLGITPRELAGILRSVPR
jgi:hypothetical protein